jgi:hypothetical protein
MKSNLKAFTESKLLKLIYRIKCKNCFAESKALKLIFGIKMLTLIN